MTFGNIPESQRNIDCKPTAILGSSPALAPHVLSVASQHDSWGCSPLLLLRPKTSVLLPGPVWLIPTLLLPLLRRMWLLPTPDTAQTGLRSSWPATHCDFSTLHSCHLLVPSPCAQPETFKIQSAQCLLQNLSWDFPSCRSRMWLFRALESYSFQPLPALGWPLTLFPLHLTPLLPLSSLPTLSCPLPSFSLLFISFPCSFLLCRPLLSSPLSPSLHSRHTSLIQFLCWLAGSLHRDPYLPFPLPQIFSHLFSI